jgi:hypothetical protein
MPGLPLGPGFFAFGSLTIFGPELRLTAKENPTAGARACEQFPKSKIPSVWRDCLIARLAGSLVCDANFHIAAMTPPPRAQIRCRPIHLRVLPAPTPASRLPAVAGIGTVYAG